MNIVPASLGKRSGAAILDVFIAALVWFGLLAYGVQPIFNTAFDVYLIQDQYQAIQIDSKLYVENAEYSTVNVLDAEDYPTGVLEYYTVYKFGKYSTGEEYSIPWYNEHILLIGTETSLFQYQQILGVDDPTLVGIAKPVENPETLTSAQLSSANAASASAVTSFFAAAYSAAVSDLNLQPAYLTLATQLSNYFVWELAISIALSLLIFFLLIPMLLKDGKTIGKQIFGLSLVNKLGYKVTKLQILFRFLSFAIIEVFGSFYTMMGTILISYTMMVFGKKSMSIHDFLASTRVIDGKHSVWFKNADEAAKYQAEVDATAHRSPLLEPLLPTHETVIDGVVTPSLDSKGKSTDKNETETNKKFR